MKNIIFLFFLGFSLIVQASKTVDSSDLQTGKDIFERFLDCQRKFKTPDEGHQCAGQYLTKEMSESQRYEFIFRAKVKIRDLSKCDKQQQDLITGLEKSSYDFYLCFSTSYTGRDQTGVVFFKKQNHSLKISKIKI